MLNKINHIISHSISVKACHFVIKIFIGLYNNLIYCYLLETYVDMKFHKAFLNRCYCLGCKFNYTLITAIVIFGGYVK
jgi:hypothetical protein